MLKSESFPAGAVSNLHTDFEFNIDGLWLSLMRRKILGRGLEFTGLLET
jgi:hypothetical protein